MIDGNFPLSLTFHYHWFNPDKLLKLIEPHINNIHTGNKWQAFTCKGIVYIRPDFLYDKSKELCRESRSLDLTFIYDSEMENALRIIVSSLRKSNLIPDILKPNQYARRFEVRTKMNKQRYVLTPVKSDQFNLQELESRKMGYLEIIENVVPVN